MGTVSLLRFHVRLTGSIADGACGMALHRTKPKGLYLYIHANNISGLVLQLLSPLMRLSFFIAFVFFKFVCQEGDTAAAVVSGPLL